MKHTIGSIIKLIVTGNLISYLNDLESSIQKMTNDYHASFAQCNEQQNLLSKTKVENQDLSSRIEEMSTQLDEINDGIRVFVEGLQQLYSFAKDSNNKKSLSHIDYVLSKNGYSLKEYEDSLAHWFYSNKVNNINSPITTLPAIFKDDICVVKGRVVFPINDN